MKYILESVIQWLRSNPVSERDSLIISDLGCYVPVSHSGYPISTDQTAVDHASSCECKCESDVCDIILRPAHLRINIIDLARNGVLIAEDRDYPQEHGDHSFLQWSPAEIISHLTRRGCQNLTYDLDSSSFSAHPVSQGGYGSVYREKLLDGRRVAIKALRVSLDDDDEADKLPKRAARELYAWSKCQHRNVLPLLGLVLYQGQIRMVSLWVENGSLPSYLNKHPDVDRCYMPSSAHLLYGQSTQICDGVAYLHDTGVIHGDLKGNNVLVSEKGVPMITDFGNAILEHSTMQFAETKKLAGCTIQWTVCPAKLEV
ncbi:hypothetical protein FRC12_007116 [Ceratobasidium sp. 428]|nr:hypothetical protein FRC12_007116 [Ceratobasidium sp. 428]